MIAGQQRLLAPVVYGCVGIATAGGSCCSGRGITTPAGFRTTTGHITGPSSTLAWPRTKPIASRSIVSPTNWTRPGSALTRPTFPPFGMWFDFLQCLFVAGFSDDDGRTFSEPGTGRTFSEPAPHQTHTHTHTRARAHTRTPRISCLIGQPHITFSALTRSGDTFRRVDQLHSAALSAGRAGRRCFST